MQDVASIRNYRLGTIKRSHAVVGGSPDGGHRVANELVAGSSQARESSYLP